MHAVGVSWACSYPHTEGQPILVNWDDCHCQETVGYIHSQQVLG